jgi:hypothetical protein
LAIASCIDAEQFTPTTNAGGCNVTGMTAVATIPKRSPPFSVVSNDTVEASPLSEPLKSDANWDKAVAL